MDDQQGDGTEGVFPEGSIQSGKACEPIHHKGDWSDCVGMRRGCEYRINFEIPNYQVSGLRIKGLAVDTQDKNYNA